MGVTAVLLAVALGSTGYVGGTLTNWPAQCFLIHNFASLESESPHPRFEYNSLYMTIVLSFLSFSYLSRVVQLFPSMQQALRQFFRSRTGRAIRSWLLSGRNRATTASRKSTRKFWLSAHTILLSLYCILEAVADLYGSLLWEVCLK